MAVRRSLAITWFATHGFRNLSQIALAPDLRTNAFVGANGQGKTSLLEAIDYAATLRSFRQASRSQLIQHDARDAEVLLRVDGGAAPHELRVHIDRASRQVALDGKRPTRAVDYYGAAACVVFQPEDLQLIRGAPALRRRLLDRVLVRIVDGYGEALRTYAKALSARNALLRTRSIDTAAIAAFEPSLARSGAWIAAQRTALAEALVPHARAAIVSMDHPSSGFALRYRTRAPNESDAYIEQLQRTRESDRARGMTQFGPHADDLVIEWTGRAARTVASQGQTRAVALALRLAELALLHARTGLWPILLLDDVSSELDRDRTERLFAQIRATEAQLWVTTTDPSVLQLLPSPTVFSVVDGTVRS